MFTLTPRRIALVAAALSALAAVPAAGQLDNELFKLTASDAAAGDNFGIVVSVSGSTAVVGAYFDNIGAGSAYVFDTTTGEQLFKLTASDAAELDFFGTSVAVSGTTAIVGAPSNDDGGTDSGSAYVFNTTTGQQLFKLTASDAAAGDNFGNSVAISGTTAIVGAYFDDGVGFDSGSVYLFDTTTGQQLFKLTAFDAAANDIFGFSVAISGTTAIVGTNFDDDAGFSSGSAYVFDTTTGEQVFKLTASDATADAGFGATVGISDSTVIVGAWGTDDAGPDSGSAYVFDATTGLQLYKLTAPDAAAGDNFGISVAISGTTAIVGALFDDDAGSDAGSAYAFNTTNGQQISKLVASDTADLDFFGTSVAISGTTAVIGANADDDGGTESGSAYVFTVIGPCLADFNGDGVLDFFDVQAFLGAFAASDSSADINNDGAFDFFDVQAFLNLYSAGCP
jgi:FG-GAP repeat protein